MRKSIFLIICVVFFAALLPAEDKFFVSAGAAAVYPADRNFRDFYGKVQFSPELKAGYHFSNSLYLWLGYSFYSASYTIPVLLDEADVSQHFLALGVGWETRRGRRLQSDFFAALVLAGFKEQAMGETVKDSALGFEVGTGLRYFLIKKIFVGAALAYSDARISLTETATSLGGRRLLGGFRLLANLGIRF